MRYNFGEYSALPYGAFEKLGRHMRLMGGGGFLGLGSAPSAPPPPDYRGAARETAAGNLEAARAQLAGSLVNQYTPYGSLEYTKRGTDEFGNPNYSATTSLTPAGQAVLNQQNKLSEGLFGGQNQALGYINEQLAKRFDTSDLPGIGIDPGQDYRAAYLEQLQPQIDTQREQLEQNLANSGIAPGSKAYERAHQQQAQRENNLLAQSVTQGLDKGLAARQQQLQEKAYVRNEPVNLLASLRSGSQVTNPEFINTPSQAATQGPDLLGAAQAQHNAALSDFNAKQASQAGLNSGLFQLGGAALTAFCDSRLKENMTYIGQWNVFPVYEFNYIDRNRFGDSRYIGLMAQDVQARHPECVGELNGSLFIDYGRLGALYA